LFAAGAGLWAAGNAASSRAFVRVVRRRLAWTKDADGGERAFVVLFAAPRHRQGAVRAVCRVKTARARGKSSTFLQPAAGY